LNVKDLNRGLYLKGNVIVQDYSTSIRFKHTLHFVIPLHKYLFVYVSLRALIR
jgi:hypothetical protein